MSEVGTLIDYGTSPSDATELSEEMPNPSPNPDICSGWPIQLFEFYDGSPEAGGPPPNGVPLVWGFLLLSYPLFPPPSLFSSSVVVVLLRERTQRNDASPSPSPSPCSFSRKALRRQWRGVALVLTLMLMLMLVIIGASPKGWGWG